MADAPVLSSLGKLTFVALLNGATVDDQPRTDAPRSRATWPLQEGGGTSNDDHSAAGAPNADGALPMATGALLTDEALRRRFRNRSRRRKSSASTVGDAAVVAALSTSGQQLFSTGSSGGSPSLPLSPSARRGKGEQETEAETEAAGGGEHTLKEQSYPSPLVSSAQVEAVIKASFAKMASLKKMGSLGKMAFLSLDDSVSSNEGGGGEGGEGGDGGKGGDGGTRGNGEDGGDGENLFASPSSGALLADEALRRRFRNRSRRRKSSASTVGDAAVVAALSTSGQQLFSTGSSGGSPSLPLSPSARRGKGEQETEAETEAAGGGEHTLKEQSYPSPLVSSAQVEAVIKASFAKMASLKKMGSLGKMAFLSEGSVGGTGGNGEDGGDGENGVFASPSSSDGVFASALVASSSSAHDDAGPHLLPLPAPRVLVEPDESQRPTFRGRRHSFQHSVGVPGVGGVSGASGESSVSGTQGSSRRGSLESRSDSRWRKIRWHKKTAPKSCSSHPPRKYRPEHGLDPKTQRARERLASRFSALGFPHEGCMQALKEAQLDVELTCKLLLFYYPKGEGVRNMVRSLVRVITTAEMKLTAMLDEFKETMADGTVDERLNAVMVYFEKCDQQNTG